VKQITARLTEQELDLLTEVAPDQFFQREIIDPHLPGHQANRPEIDRGKALVVRLKALLNSRTLGPGARTASASVHGVSNAQEWIYLGGTGNIRKVLLLHLQELNLPALQRRRRHPS